MLVRGKLLQALGAPPVPCTLADGLRLAGTLPRFCGLLPEFVGLGHVTLLFPDARTPEVSSGFRHKKPQLHWKTEVSRPEGDSAAGVSAAPIRLLLANRPEDEVLIRYGRGPGHYIF